ncbi:hypothetical protein ACFV6E_39755 [Streptomyces sp. NPDC059785]|uniref:hypothetical protein n=1 Tax=unclassified Streptomyces TaxID=2593676 RepID=UPI0036531DBA
MVFIAMGIPPMMLGLLLALGRYEDKLFGPDEAPRHARPHRHLFLVRGSGSGAGETGRTAAEPREAEAA